MPLEPAVEAQTIFVFADGEGLDRACLPASVMTRRMAPKLPGLSVRIALLPLHRRAFLAHD